MVTTLESELQRLQAEFPAFTANVKTAEGALRDYSKAGGDALKLLIEKSKEFGDQLKSKDGVEKFVDNIKDAVIKGKELFQGLDDSFKALLTTAQSVGDGVKTAFAQLKGGAQGPSNEIFEAAGAATLLTAAFAGLNANEAFAKLSLDIGNANNKFAGLLTAFGDNKLSAGIKNLLDASEATKQFELSIMRAAASSGAFNEVLGIDEPTRNLASNLDWATDRIQQSARQAALNMGMSYQDSIKQTMEVLKLLPAEFEKSGDQITRSYQVFANSAPVDAMELLETVAKGTGQTFDTVLDVANKMWATFGSNSKEAAERTAILHRVSNDLNIPFETLKGTIQSVDDNFKLWGNNAESTLSVLGQISTVLKEQGVGYQAQLEIVNSLSGAMKGLGIEKKAYIGMEAGLGGSAISAGLQVEQMIQQGDWGKVAGMMQQSIGNIGGTGGQVLSMNDALQTPGQEQAFMAQRMALGNIFGVQDVGMQNRLMEVMSKVSLGSELQIDGAKTLEEAFSAGKVTQEKQFNVLENIYTEVFSMSQIAAGRTAYGQTQKLFGPGSEGISDEDALTSQAARSETFNEKELLTPEGRARQIADFVSTEAGSIRDALKTLVERVSDIKDTAMKDTVGAVTSLQKRQAEADDQQDRLRQREEAQRKAQEGLATEEEEDILGPRGASPELDRAMRAAAGIEEEYQLPILAGEAVETAENKGMFSRLISGVVEFYQQHNTEEKTNVTVKVYLPDGEEIDPKMIQTIHDAERTNPLPPKR